MKKRLLLYTVLVMFCAPVLAQVGIGTTAPIGLLDIYDEADVDVYIRTTATPPPGFDRAINLRLDGDSESNLFLGTDGTYKGKIHTHQSLAGTYLDGLLVEGVRRLGLRVDDSTKMVVLSNGHVGIGTTDPRDMLHVVSTGPPLRLEGVPTAGSETDYLVIGSTGIVLKRPGVSNVGWSLTGNSGTVYGTNFIGTTDSVALQFRVNNRIAGVLNPGLLNTGFGNHVLTTNTTGNNNAAFGYKALSANTIGNRNTALGTHALLVNTAGEGNVAVGMLALGSNTSGGANVAAGINALQQNTLGEQNVAVGQNALLDNTEGNGNVAIGAHALQSIRDTKNNVAVGILAGQQAAGDNNVFLGAEAGYYETGSDRLYIANGATTPANTLIYGQFDNKIVAIDGKLGLGLTIPTAQLEMTGDMRFPAYPYPGPYPTTGMIYKGTQTYIHNFGPRNFFAGVGAGNLTMTGADNVAVGYFAFTSNTSGGNNATVGYRALQANTTGSENVSIGWSALSNNTTGSSNVAIGGNANTSSGNLTYATAIGAGALVGASYSMVLGGTGPLAVNVGIGTSLPANALHVSATANPLRLDGLKQEAGDTLLTLNAGVVHKSLLPELVGATAWALAGNSGTTPGTDFLGTTDEQSLVFKTNDAEVMRIMPSGYIGIGTTDPIHKIDIFAPFSPTIRFRGGPAPSDGPRFVLSNGSNDRLALSGNGVSPGMTINGNGRVTTLAAGSLKLLADGSENQLFLSTTGPVGMGTILPTARLHISTTTTGKADLLRLEREFATPVASASSIVFGHERSDNTQADFNRIEFDVTNISTGNEESIWNLYALHRGTENSLLTLYSGGAAEIHGGLDVEGNIHTDYNIEMGQNLSIIGLTALRGDINTLNDTKHLNIGYDGSPSTQYHALRIHTYGSERMMIDSLGNVGIGTTGPEVLLHLKTDGLAGAEIIRLEKDNPSVNETSEIGYYQANSTGLKEFGKIVFGSDFTVPAGDGTFDIWLKDKFNVLHDVLAVRVDGVDIQGAVGCDGLSLQSGTLADICANWVQNTSSPVPANSTYDFDLSCPGVNTGLTDVPIVTPTADLPAGLIVGSVRVSSANNVRIRIANITGASITLPAIYWDIKVLR